MDKVAEKEAIRLLKKYAPDKRSYTLVLAHSKLVQKVALKIAKKIKGVDIAFIKTAALLHDIGRFRCPPGPKTIFHGIEGAKILRKEGLQKHAKLAERHLGAGINKKDIEEQRLPLPKKDYMPRTIEEKIITHADNLVFGTRVGTLKEVEARFRKEVSEKIARRARKLYESIKAKFA